MRYKCYDSFGSMSHIQGLENIYELLRLKREGNISIGNRPDSTQFLRIVYC